MLVALQVIIITILSIVIYKNSVNTYLTAKDDIIKYWLDGFKSYTVSEPVMLWAMDYWEEHPEATKQPMADDENIEILKTLHETVISDDPEETVSNLENASDEVQLAAAQFYYSDFKDIFDKSDYTNYGVTDVGCFRVDDDGMVLTFHAMSLPTARLVCHCPFLNVFGADDGKVYGDNYRDYMLVRLDGECWEGDPGCTVTAEHSRSDDFTGWDDWKERSKAGFDCTFTFERKGNFITVRTENGGVVIKSTAEITDGNETIYAAVTGDQVAITNIRIIKQIR